MASSYPDVGQTVRVRERTWVVTDIKQNALNDRPHRIVDLLSLEDDAVGEELQVLWDVEPGAEPLGHSTLPEMRGFDPPERLNAFLDAVRWGAIASADVKRLQSPFRAGIQIDDYQLAPVSRALTMPRVNLLIADDVGLGKTVEAGLVMLELMLRHRTRSVLVVCPPSLQVQWRDQMLEKFGLEFRIVDRQLFREVRRTRGIHANPWQHFPRLITSIDFLKRDQPMRLMRDALPGANESRYPRRFDLLIVDEAHNIAPVSGSKYAHASDRTRAIREITPHFEHRLFLSATPHNGYSESFWALLELLDDQRFARAVKPDQKQIDAVMIRRLKSELREDWTGKSRFPPRVLEAIEVAYSDDERHAHALLTEYGRLRREQAGADRAAQISVEFVLKTLKKRLFSSPRAFSRTIEQHIRTVDSPKLRVTIKPPVRDLRARLEAADAPIESDEDAGEATSEAFELAEDVAPISETARRKLTELRTWAERASDKPDSKASELLAWLRRHVKDQDERVIIFTEYRDTQSWLFELLAAAGLTRNGLTELMHGGLDRDERERIKAAFQADPAISAVRILLATDAASEGLDLQNFCHQIIHYEIPWNPNRLEQRNGRVDRHGQKAPDVRIYHFVGQGFDEELASGRLPGDLDGDIEFLARAAVKMNRIREDLGSAGTVLASTVEQAMLGESAEANRNLETLGADDRTRRTKLELLSTRNAWAEIDQAMQTLRDTRNDLRLEPERVSRAVATALKLAGQPALQPTTVEGQPAWIVPALAGNWGETRAGLAHPFTGRERPIVFDDQVAKLLGDQVVHAHLNHPLVQRCLRLLRAAMWGDREVGLHRVTARVVPDSVLETPAVVAHGRLVITGGDGERLHEQLITAGGVVREGRFSRLNVGEVDNILSAQPLDTPVPSGLLDAFQALWDGIQPGISSALIARRGDRTAGLMRDVRAREQQEAESITAILTELKAAIERELKAPDILQLNLFDDPDDRDQIERDRNALEDRLRRIPSELEQELAAIRRRYEKTEPRLFPVAVTWYVPRSIAMDYQS